MQFRKAVLYGKGDLRLEMESVSRPLKPEEILIQTEVTALSTGTDLGNYLGDSTYVPGAPDYPRSIGYSNVGIVCETGSEVNRIRRGDRLFSMKPHCSGFITQSDDLLVPIPDSVSSEEASLAYLTQLGLVALRKGRFEAGENLVVVGLGVIGLATIALGRAIGATVVGVANSNFRAKVALEMGARACFSPNEAGLGSPIREALEGKQADIVVLTSNTWESYFLGLHIARVGGRVCVLGFPGRSQPMSTRNPLDPSLFYAKQLALFACGDSSKSEHPPSDTHFNLRRNLKFILDLLSDKRMNLAPLITHRLKYARMQEAYELAREHSKELIAAIFLWK